LHGGAFVARRRTVSQYDGTGSQYDGTGRVRTANVKGE
jgi:hypothetical protein